MAAIVLGLDPEVFNSESRMKQLNMSITKKLKQTYHLSTFCLCELECSYFIDQIFLFYSLLLYSPAKSGTCYIVHADLELMSSFPNLLSTGITAMCLHVQPEFDSSWISSPHFSLLSALCPQGLSLLTPLRISFLVKSQNIRLCGIRYILFIHPSFNGHVAASVFGYCR